MPSWEPSCVRLGRLSVQRSSAAGRETLDSLESRQIPDISLARSSCAVYRTEWSRVCCGASNSSYACNYNVIRSSTASAKPLFTSPERYPPTRVPYMQVPCRERQISLSRDVVHAKCTVSPYKHSICTVHLTSNTIHMDDPLWILISSLPVPSVRRTAKGSACT